MQNLPWWAGMESSSRRVHGPPLLYPLPPVGYEEEERDDDDDDHDHDNVLYFHTGEHVRLADTIDLTTPNGTTHKGKDWKLFQISGRNGDSTSVMLSYGQISALAGDFYGTYTPICTGETDEARLELFNKAWETLETDKPENVERLLKLMDKDIQAVKDAIAKGEPGSSAYYLGQCVKDPEWQNATKKRENPDLPTYMGLASINLDHFGDDAYNVYCTIHRKAILVASKGNLERGYAINAYADHFLQDLFSAGHIRTPRRLLHGPASDYPKDRKLDTLAEEAFATLPSWEASQLLSLDAMSKYMHDEESYFGLRVQDKKKPRAQWRCYGDARLFDHKPESDYLQTSRLCREAVQKSVDEVYQAWRNKTISSEPYNLEKARPEPMPQNDQDLQPLVRVEDGKLHLRMPWGVRNSSAVSILSSKPWFVVSKMHLSSKFAYPMQFSKLWMFLLGLAGRDPGPN